MARGPVRGALRLPALQTRRHCRAPHPAPSSNAAIDDALDEQGARMIRPVQGGGDNHTSESQMWRGVRPGRASARTPANADRVANPNTKLELGAQLVLRFILYSGRYSSVGPGVAAL